MISNKKQRGRPIYVQTGAGTISLVPEVRVLELRLPGSRSAAIRWVRPHAVYIIGQDGVQQKRVRDTSTLIAGLLIAGSMLGLLSSLRWGVRGKREGRKGDERHWLRTQVPIR